MAVGLMPTGCLAFLSGTTTPLSGSSTNCRMKGEVAFREHYIYAFVYQLAGRPDLAEPYFEMAKEMLEQRVADPNFAVGGNPAGS